MSEKEMGLIIFVTLVVRRAPNLTLCTGTSCISLGLSADHSLPFCLHGLLSLPMPLL